MLFPSLITVQWATAESIILLHKALILVACWHKGANKLQCTKLILFLNQLICTFNIQQVKKSDLGWFHSLT